MSLEEHGLKGMQESALGVSLTRRSVLKRSAFFGITAVVGSSLLAACGGDDDDESPATATTDSSAGSGTATTASTGGDDATATTAGEEPADETPSGDTGSADGMPAFDTPDRASLPSPQKIIYAGLRDPDTLDVNVSVFGHVHRIMCLTYEPLVIETRSNEFVPCLADAWEISSDGLAYTFTTRQGVKFHDGTDFDAEAVKFAFDRIVDPATQSKRAINLIGPYDGSEVADPTTVTLKLKEPFAAFLDGISYTFCGIPSPAAIQEKGEDYGRSPVGTGPMKFKEWVAQDSVTFEKFEDYDWASPLFNLDGPAYLDEFIYRVVPEEATRSAVLETGEVDIIDFIPAKDVEKFQSDDNYSVIIEPTPGMPSVYLLNTEKPPLDDIKVRQALIHAIDKQEFSDAISYGTQNPTYGPLASTTFGYNPEVETLYPYDPEKAASLLDEAGWTMSGDTREKNGDKLELDLLTITSNAQHEYLQAVLGDLGIKVNILTGTDAWWQESGIRGDHHLLSEGISGSDPSLLTWQFHSRNIESGFARTRFKDTEMDELLDQGGVSTDPGERKEIYGQIQMIIMNNALIIPIYEGTMSLAMNPKVKNIALDARVYYTWMHSAYVSE